MIENFFPPISDISLMEKFQIDIFHMIYFT